MKFNLKEVYSILDLKEKKQIISVIILQAFSGLLDVVGILSIMPFLATVTNPEILSTNKYLSLIQVWTNFDDKELIIFFGKDRKASVSRELTKIYQENTRGTLEELFISFETRIIKGEIVLIIDGK